MRIKNELGSNETEFVAALNNRVDEFGGRVRYPQWNKFYYRGKIVIIRDFGRSKVFMPLTKFDTEDNWNIHTLDGGIEEKMGKVKTHLRDTTINQVSTRQSIDTAHRIAKINTSNVQLQSI